MRHLRTAYIAIAAASIVALPLAPLVANRPVSEREKFEADQAYRSGQLALTAGEQELRRQEQEQSRWTSPLVLAIAAAAIAALGNALVAYVNGRQQRRVERDRTEANRDLEQEKAKNQVKLERDKAAAQIRLERDKTKAQMQLDSLKAESDRILEVVKTGGSTEAAAANLQFLLDAGLVTQPGLDNRLRAFLASRVPGTGPTLPAADGRFRFEASPDTAPEVTELEQCLRKFCAYLDSVGFALPEREASIAFEDDSQSAYSAHYDQDNKRVVIGQVFRNEPYAVYREYMHHILLESSSGPYSNKFVQSIQSGLADYYPASFLGTPFLGTKTAQIYGLAYIRTVESDDGFDKLNDDIWTNNGKIWGSLFWDIRNGLGQAVSDKLLLGAWKATKWPSDPAKSYRAFVKTLLVSAGKLDVNAGVTINALLRHRGFPLPR